MENGVTDSFPWPDIKESSLANSREVVRCLSQPTAPRYGCVQLPVNDFT